MRESEHGEPEEEVITRDIDKAELFAKGYAEVCNVTSAPSPPSQRAQRPARCRPQPPCRPPATRVHRRVCEDESIEDLCAPFTMSELSVVLQNLKKGKAPGIDSICAEMLQNIGSSGEEFLLRLANRSWVHAEVPHPWRVAEVVPVFKGNGKDPNIRASWRPISLTSIVSKVVERLVRNRVMDFLERHQLIAREQAGYRMARNVEEHCVRLSQNIHDSLGIGDHTVLLSIDATAAFDRMVKGKLYEKMYQKGLPEQVVNWVTSFLTDRKARVRVGHATSKFHTFEEGCPQGTVMGPLCWTIFIDDLQEVMKGLGAELFMYADDVCIGLHGPNLSKQYEWAQRALDLLLPWATANSVKISMYKTSVTVFSPGATVKKKKAKGGTQHMNYPDLKYGDETVEYKAEGRFLGVWYDENFTFNRHIEEVHTKITERFKILKSVSGTKWGCKRSTLRTMYLARMQSCVDFSLPAYAPFVNSDALKDVRTVEKEAAMRIGGCVGRSRLTAIYGEAGTQPIDLRIKLSSATMYERLRRLPDDNPARMMAERPEPKTRGRGGKRHTACDVVEKSGLRDLKREQIPTHSLDGAAHSFSRAPTFRPFLCEKVTKSDTAERREQAALKTIALLPHPDVSVNTDGSVLVPEESKHGGGGFFLVDGNGKIHTDRIPAGKLCSSYRAEMHGLLHALNCILEPDSEIVLPRGAEIQMLTDSQSATRSLAKGQWKQSSVIGQKIWAALSCIDARYGAHVTLAYVPGHVGLDGNSAADKEAKGAARDAADAGDDGTAINIDTAKSAIRNYGRKEQWDAVERNSHWWHSTGGKLPKYPAGLTRGQERVVAQLRAGKCPILADYNKLCGWADSPACACGAPVEDVKHLILDCPLHEVPRQAMLTPKAQSLDILAREPGRVLRFLRTIGRAVCAAQKPAAPAGITVASAATTAPVTTPAAPTTNPSASASASTGSGAARASVLGRPC